MFIFPHDQVGLHSEHGYARSLARFAAGLGKDVWKIASKKIANALPAGVEFGPGWVGGNSEALPSLLCENQKSSDNSSLFAANGSPSLPCEDKSGEEAVRGLNPQSELTSRPGIHPGMNGFGFGYGFNPSSRMGTARLAIPTGNSGTDTEEAASTPSQKLGFVSKASWQGLAHQRTPPDLNVRFLAPGSPSSSTTPVSSSSQQPDLALQL